MVEILGGAIAERVTRSSVSERLSKKLTYRSDWWGDDRAKSLSCNDFLAAGTLIADTYGVRMSDLNLVRSTE